jgi:hypothetical protein
MWKYNTPETLMVSLHRIFGEGRGSMPCLAATAGKTRTGRLLIRLCIDTPLMNQSVELSRNSKVTGSAHTHVWAFPRSSMLDGPA